MFVKKLISLTNDSLLNFINISGDDKEYLKDHLNNN